ncbi:hypothetical protein CYY_001680 [Polysphondylium violaceum]|uniref:Uncharacterized protein n=1 Tax=Polysphondylium violaceum TaxID=133409 RepID=A0A8J4PZH3_9MYCE|nr:hypothetical protein CYY_001680 [Polysphondylium violaceum]
MEEQTIIQNIKQYCQKNGIKTNKILVITIQENRGTSFCSLIVDFEKEKLLENYPAELLNAYKEKREGDYLICYLENLDEIKNLQPQSSVDKQDNQPFCCKNITPYKSIRTDRDTVFRDFISGQGNHPEYVFEIKEQVDNGPLLSTHYYVLENGHISRTTTKPTQKVHSFKNYKCLVHKLFYAVDLYKKGDAPGYNFHHMRLNPYQNINQQLLNNFFTVSNK